MSSFLLALQFLTILPLNIKNVSGKRLPHAMIFFPVVGIILGFFLVGIQTLFAALNFTTVSINILLVITLSLISGGMHLDGLCDTADALLSRKPRQEMLAIMRDSHIGVMGALSLISILLVKIGLLSSLGAPLKVNALILMCMVSRWAAVLSMFLFPYAREDGKAKVFIEGMDSKILFFSTLITFLSALLIWQLKGILIFLLIGGCVYVSGRFIVRKFGGITGDTLGATIELTETMVLFSACL
jgi:adenosylcobinamide-GDP ribazoletransferase